MAAFPLAAFYPTEYTEEFSNIETAAGAIEHLLTAEKPVMEQALRDFLLESYEVMFGPRKQHVTREEILSRRKLIRTASIKRLVRRLSFTLHTSTAAGVIARALLGSKFAEGATGLRCAVLTYDPELASYMLRVENHIPHVKVLAVQMLAKKILADCEIGDMYRPELRHLVRHLTQRPTEFTTLTALAKGGFTLALAILCNPRYAADAGLTISRNVGKFLAESVINNPLPATRYTQLICLEFEAAAKVNRAAQIKWKEMRTIMAKSVSVVHWMGGEQRPNNGFAVTAKAKAAKVVEGAADVLAAHQAAASSKAARLRGMAAVAVAVTVEAANAAAEAKAEAEADAAEAAAEAEAEADADAVVPVLPRANNVDAPQ